MTVYGYCRCSTNEEMQNIDRQVRDVMTLGVTDKANIYKEYVSGTKEDRIELNRLLDKVKHWMISIIIIVCILSYFTMNVATKSGMPGNNRRNITKF